MTSITMAPPRDSQDPKALCFGGRKLYNVTGNFSVGSQVRYSRVMLEAGQTINAMKTFIDAVPGGAPGTKTIRMGLYSQTDPLDPTLGPNAKLAQTASRNINGDAGSFVEEALESTYLVTVTGWYWVAIANQNVGVDFRASADYPAGYLGAQQETTTVDNLPATAAGSIYQGPLVYCAAVEA